jgi:hypothetical protein
LELLKPKTFHYLIQSGCFISCVSFSEDGPSLQDQQPLVNHRNNPMKEYFFCEYDTNVIRRSIFTHIGEFLVWVSAYRSQPFVKDGSETFSSNAKSGSKSSTWIFIVNSHWPKNCLKLNYLIIKDLFRLFIREW